MSLKFTSSAFDLEAYQGDEIFRLRPPLPIELRVLKDKVGEGDRHLHIAWV